MRSPLRAVTPDDIHNIAWLSDAQVSPDGTRIAFVITRLDRDDDAYRSAIWLARTDGSVEPRQLTAGTKRDTAPRWSPDGRELAFLSERGEAKAQLFLLPTGGGEARQLTSLPLGAGPAVWAPDGRRIAFSAKTGTPPDPDPKKAKPYRRITTLKYRMNGEGFTYDRRPHIFVVDTAEGSQPRQATHGEHNDTAPAWSPDGAEIAFVSARHDEEDYDSITDIFAVTVATGWVRKITATKGNAIAPAFSPDGTQVACLYRTEYPANPHVAVVPATGGTPIFLDPAFDRTTGAASPTSESQPPRWLPDGNLLVAAEDRGTTSLFTVRPGEPVQWLAPSRRVITSYSVSANANIIAFTATTPGQPVELFVLHRTSGMEIQLTKMNASWLGEVSVARADRFVLPRADGLELDYWVMKPQSMEPGRQYPVLLSIHGGPFTQYGEQFFDEFQVYTGAGYGVVFCNPRGSSGQDTPFSRAVVGHMGEPDYEDVMACFEAALERMPWADTSRLGIIGGSYGGFMTSWVIAKDHRFAAAVSERAVNDWYGMQGTSDIASTFNVQYLGDDARIHDNLEAVLRQSPLTHARDITTPVLVLHSEDDLRVPISQGEQFYAALKLMRKDVEMVRFPDENHELSRNGRPSHRVDRFNVIIEYFDRKMPG